MKVSFDFDSTLAEERIQRLAAKFLKDGHELWIVTSRVHDGRWDWNRDVFMVAEMFGIPKERIVFTNGADKWLFLKEIDIHFDDDIVEIERIEENLKSCVGVCILDP